jgi:hypothetical protein
MASDWPQSPNTSVRDIPNGRSCLPAFWNASTPFASARAGQAVGFFPPERHLEPVAGGRPSYPILRELGCLAPTQPPPIASVLAAKILSARGSSTGRGTASLAVSMVRAGPRRGRSRRTTIARGSKAILAAGTSQPPQ